jgi:hypothetical protein
LSWHPESEHPQVQNENAFYTILQSLVFVLQWVRYGIGVSRQVLPEKARTYLLPSHASFSIDEQHQLNDDGQFFNVLRWWIEVNMSGAAKSG